MTARRIVLLNQYFPPDTSATARIVRDFVEQCEALGVDVTVVCGYPSYEPETRPSWRPLRRIRQGGVTTLVVGSTGFDRRNALARVANYLSFIIGVTVVLPFVCADAAFVVMTDPPMAPLFAWWAKRTGRPASATVWVQDLHPDFGVAAGLIGNGPVTRLWRRMLRRSLDSADDIAVLGRDMEQRIRELGVTTATHTVHNGWSGVEHQHGGSNVSSGPLRVMHIGNLGFAGPWETVAAAAGELVGTAEFVFVGGGAAEDVLRKAAVPNVEMVGRVPHAEVSRLAAEADLLLVGTRRGLEGYVVPSKGYEMMALGRPMLVIGAAHAEMRLLVEEIGCGFVSDDAPADLVRVIRSAATERASFEAMAERGVAASETYRRDKQFGAFVTRLTGPGVPTT